MYINYPKIKSLVGELRKVKALNEVKLVDELLKYMQSWVFVPKSKLRLLVLKEQYDSPFGDQKEGKTTIEWCQ